MPVSDTIPGWNGMKPFVFGAASGSMATCVVQPIDMVKVRIQLMEGKSGGSTNPISIFQGIVKNEGVGALYKGLSAGLLRQCTYGTTRLGMFQYLEETLTGDDGKLSFVNRLGASLAAGGIGALVGTPADAALVRMQADTVLPLAERRGYKNGVDAMIRMAREEGMAGFFSGAGPTVLRGLSINVGMLVSYGYYKKLLLPLGGEDTQINRFGAGALSGWTAATVSLPFDFVKTRLQKQKPGPDGKVPYAGFVDCVKKVAAAEGWMSFYQGYATFVVRIAPHIMLTWVFLDNFKAMAMLQ